MVENSKKIRLKKFNSTALKKGKKYGGTFEAKDLEDALRKLFAQGFAVTSLREVKYTESATNVTNTSSVARPKLEKVPVAKKQQTAVKGKTVAKGSNAEDKAKPANSEKLKGFPDSVVKEAWKRAGGRCECKSSEHRHMGRCLEILQENKRGMSNKDHSWQAFKPKNKEGYTLANCRILCWDCYKLER